MTTALAARYLEALTCRLGLDAVEDHRGNIVIRRAGLTFVAFIDPERDPEYLRLAVLASRPDSDVSDSTLIGIANRVNSKLKCVCVTVDDRGNTAFAVEMLVAAPDCLPSADHLAAVLPRAMSMIASGARAFTADIAIEELEASISE